MASDLRESGSLEQDADVVILLHREDAYERESTRPGEADFIVAKHRNGPTGIVHLRFPLAHRRAIRTTNLLSRSYTGQIPNGPSRNAFVVRPPLRSSTRNWRP